MKTVIVMFFFISILTFKASSQSLHLDLQSQFNRDVVLEVGGSGIGDPPDLEDGIFVDGATLPPAFQDGSVWNTADGRTSFLFAPLLEPSLDAFAVDGQNLDVPEGRYRSFDFAYLSAPGSLVDPFQEMRFLYVDGSESAQRFAPLPGWFASPAAFENTRLSVVDDSAVETLIAFDTDFEDDELTYLFQELGNGNAGGSRFVDGTGFALYLLEVDPNLREATLGVTVGNNFVISVATDFFPPEISTEEGYTVLANSMELFDGFEHRALGNLRLYEFDMAPFLAEGTGELFILFTDATPQNGWGPFIQNISLFTGEVRRFEETLITPIDTQNADVFADFQTDGGDAEKPFLFDNNGSGPSGRGHRFADAAGSITYRFDLPDDTSEAKITMDLANNFVVSLSGASEVTRFAQMAPGTPEEFDLLIEEGGSILGPNFRFADADAFMTYQFDLPDDLSEAYAHITVGNQFVIEMASGTNDDFTLLQDWVAETGEETRDLSNLDTFVFDLAPFLQNNPQNIVRIRLSDGLPADGWGPNLRSISILNSAANNTGTFTEVLHSMELFGEDIRNELNKQFYTVDLSQFLTNNPTKEVFVRFTDGSTSDGWGPGIFRLTVYNGDIDFQSDRPVFDDLKATNGEPVNFGLGLNHRRYPLDASKSLRQIVFPARSALEDDTAFVLGATLNPAETAVSDWMLQ